MKGLIPNQWIWLPGLGAWKCVLGRYFYVGHADNVEKPRIENHTYIGTQSRIGKFVRVRVGTNEGEDEGEFHRTVSIGIVNKNQNKDSQL